MMAHAAEGAHDDWWVIGSAAVALHGAAVCDVRDVDLMMSPRDASAFLDRVGGIRQEAGFSMRFRSDVFGRWHAPPLPVEAFGGFRVHGSDGWQTVHFATREPVALADGHVYVPSAEELIRLLHAFGRPKDLKRAALLRECASTISR